MTNENTTFDPRWRVRLGMPLRRDRPASRSGKPTLRHKPRRNTIHRGLQILAESKLTLEYKLVAAKTLLLSKPPRSVVSPCSNTELRARRLTDSEVSKARNPDAGRERLAEGSEDEAPGPLKAERVHRRAAVCPRVSRHTESAATEIGALSRARLPNETGFYAPLNATRSRVRMCSHA